MNQQILMLVSVVLVIGVICGVFMMSNSPETYTAASKFNPSNDIYIPGMKADGTIVLTHKFKDIDTAIDTAANSIKTDYVAADAVALKAAKDHTDAFKAYANGSKGYYMKNQYYNDMTWWMNNKFDPRYAKKNTNYRIMVGPGNQNPGTYLRTSLIGGVGSANKRLTFGDGNSDTANYKYQIKD